MNNEARSADLDHLKLRKPGEHRQKPAEMQPRPEALREAECQADSDPIEAETEQERPEAVDRRPDEENGSSD